MKAILSAAAAAAMLLGAPALAHAEASIYGTLGYANVDVDPVNVGGIQGRIGIDFTPYIAVEGEGTVGVVDDTVLGVKVDLVQSHGVFAVGKWPVSETVDVFVRAGFASAELDVGGVKLEDDGAAYGLGVRAFFTANDGVRLDYTHYDLADDGSVWSVSYVRKF